MRKLLLWAAALTFSFAAFLASCAAQPQAGDQKAPAPGTHRNGAGQSLMHAPLTAQTSTRAPARLDG